MIAPAGPARLSLVGITKSYPMVVANDAIDLAVAPGEIRAVLGENGAGKSTLMKIIYGVVRPDAGTIRWNGEPVVIASPARARSLGIAMVFQHFSLFETLTVAENISLAQDAARPVADLSAQVREISQRYGLPLDPERPVHTLSVAERQRVEIIRSLLQSPALLIMDEPTSVLTPQAVTNLFATLRTLAAEGCSILYISHKLDEIRELCDHATVLRNGRVTGECNPRAETPASLARMMIGGDVPHPHHRKSRAQGAPRLEVDRLSLAPDDPFGTALAEVSFRVHGGEVLGIAGISGNGQRELVAALGRRIDRSLRDMNDDRVDIAALGPKLPLEQVNRSLRLGPGQTEHGHVIRPDGLSNNGRQDRDSHPRHHNPATMSDTPASEAQHRYLGLDQT